METTIMGSIGIIRYILGLYICTMEKKMETTIMGSIWIIEGFVLARDRQPAISQVAT